MGRTLVWEGQIRGGETVYKGEASMEGKFGCLRKGSTLLGCQVGETEVKGWLRPEACVG